jgi:hypothetical protein
MNIQGTEELLLSLLDTQHLYLIPGHPHFAHHQLRTLLEEKQQFPMLILEFSLTNRLSDYQHSIFLFS